MVRACAVDSGVEAAVADGHQAVELAASYRRRHPRRGVGRAGRGRLFPGDLEAAWSARCSPASTPMPLGRSQVMRLPDRCWRWSPRTAAGWVRSPARRGGARGVGAGSPAAEVGWEPMPPWHSALCWHAGRLGAAEQEFSAPERFFQDDLASIHRAHVLVRLADVRRRRGRIDEADATMIQVHEALDELADCGAVPGAPPPLSVISSRRAGRRPRQGLQPPSEAELAVLRCSAAICRAPGIGRELFLSPNTIRSHTRALYRKLGVSSRSDAVARAIAVGLLGQLITQVGNPPRTTSVPTVGTRAPSVARRSRRSTAARRPTTPAPTRPASAPVWCVARHLPPADSL